MIILTIRTDKPEAELGLFQDQTEIAYVKWSAHRQLAESIHSQIQLLLEESSKAGKLQDINGIVIYRGPGSFTGLRIGISVANALAYSLGVPVVGMNSEEWIQGGIKKLCAGISDNVVLPDYGSEAHITLQKK